jgi:hypothetical protein
MKTSDLLRDHLPYSSEWWNLVVKRTEEDTRSGFDVFRSLGIEVDSPSTIILDLNKPKSLKSLCKKYSRHANESFWKFINSAIKPIMKKEKEPIKPMSMDELNNARNKVYGSFLENTKALIDSQSLWLCLYQYKGHETEGHLNSEPKFICKAKDATEALYKYHIYLVLQDKTKKIFWNSLEEYRESEYAEGGWGFFAYKLDEKDESYRDDTDWFYKEYKKLKLT